LPWPTRWKPITRKPRPGWINSHNQSLAKAFRGELVPQDPDDEPAEKLLERILEEKAKIRAQLKGAKKKGVKKTVNKSEGGT